MSFSPFARLFLLLAIFSQIIWLAPARSIYSVPGKSSGNIAFPFVPAPSNVVPKSMVTEVNAILHKNRRRHLGRSLKPRDFNLDLVDFTEEEEEIFMEALRDAQNLAAAALERLQDFQNLDVVAFFGELTTEGANDIAAVLEGIRDIEERGTRFIVNHVRPDEFIENIEQNIQDRAVAFVAEQLLPDNDTPQQVMFITDAFFDENQYNSLRSVSVPRDYDPLSQEQREESLHNFDSRARVVLHELTHMNVLGVQGEIGGVVDVNWFDVNINDLDPDDPNPPPDDPDFPTTGTAYGVADAHDLTTFQGGTFANMNAANYEFFAMTALITLSRLFNGDATQIPGWKGPNRGPF